MVELALHANTRSFELVVEKSKCVLDHSVEVDALEFAAGGAGEIQQAIDDLRRAKGLLRDLVEERRTFVIALKLLR